MMTARRQLGIARGTASAIIRRHKRHGNVSRPVGGVHNSRHAYNMADKPHGKSSNMADMEKTVVFIVEEHPEFTMAHINSESRHRLPQKPNVCDNTIAAALNDKLK